MPDAITHSLICEELLDDDDHIDSVVVELKWEKSLTRRKRSKRSFTRADNRTGYMLDMLRDRAVRGTKWHAWRDVPVVPGLRHPNEATACGSSYGSPGWCSRVFREYDEEDTFNDSGSK